MPKLYDISLNIETSMPAYPGDPKLHIQTLKSLDKGDPYQLFRVSMGNHTGTHVDAPAHFIAGGATVDQLPLEVLNGRVRVVEIHNSEKIDVSELQQLVLMEDFRILFKTRNSLLWRNKSFEEDFIYLTEDAASYLSENGIKLVGIDYLSIDRFGDEKHPAHKVLLSNNVIIVEGLNLAEVEEGEYDMSCLPLKFHGLDAAPARVILKK